jgi:hypothetical protein
LRLINNKQMRILGIIALVFLMSTITCSAQSSFVTKFESTANETTGWFMQNSINEYIGIVSITPYGSSIRSNYLYKIGELGDTLLSRRFENGDTLMRLHYFIQSNTDPIRYLVSGQGIVEDSLSNLLYNYFTEIDENFNSIWERYYKLRPNDITCTSEYRQYLLKRKDSGYVFVTNYDNPGDHRLILFGLSNFGDSLQYREYSSDSAGHVVMDLSYNFDSTSYLLNVFRSHPVPFWGESQLITCDLNFEQIKVDYYPRWFIDGATTKILPDNSLVTGGLYDYGELPETSSFMTYKYDTSFNLLASCSVGDPNFEIRKDNGRNTMDFYYPNSIFTAGTFDYDIGVWVQHPSWIVIGKMDENLDLLVEKYIGGDAYYHYWTITATSDGGALVTATRYDYLTQNQEHDAYIIKLDSLELSVGCQEFEANIQDALIYPNPARDHITLNTSLLDASFTLINTSGQAILSTSINSGNQHIDLQGIRPGLYLWRMFSSGGKYSSGKIIITN